MIGFRTAMILFAALAGFAIAMLKGPALYLALIIIFLVAVKSYVHHIRKRME